MKAFLRTRVLLLMGMIVAGVFFQAEQAHAETYWLQSHKDSPPYPFDPYGGAIKIEALDEKNGLFLILDTPEDYAAMQALQAAEKALDEKENGRVTLDGPEGGGEAYAYGPEDLWLEIVSKVDDTANLVIHTPDPEGVYDLFMTTNLSPNVPGLNLTNWAWLMRTSPGETNLVVTNLWADEAYFRLGTMFDSDSDGMTDAYEHLVAHTSSALPDSDGDGLSDGLEFQLGFNPLDAYSQDSSHTFKDGEWYLTAKMGQAGTRAELIWDYAEYDPWDDITYLWFSVSGVAESDQHRIYIQTPSIDATDTNLVWQDMFFNFGFWDLQFDPNTGTHGYVTAWWGDITNAAFAALDGQDRDFDGLQDGYEIFTTQTVAGAPSSDGSGISDGDAVPSGDGFSNLQKWQYGLNPWTPVSTQDTLGDGIPDWFRAYITVWSGAGLASAWMDADDDGVPNLVEFDLGGDPTIPDNWGYLSPPPGDYQFVSLQYIVAYSDADGPYYLDENQQPHGNEYFTPFGFSAAPLGLSCGMGVLTSGSPGPGVAELQFEIGALNQAYYYWAPFSDDGDPYQGELQKPDPIDGSLYRNILIQATDLANKTWTRINKDVLEALSSKSLEYVRATSTIRIHRECRKIQYYQYLIAQGANRQAMLMRIQRSASIIHTEYTKITAIQVRYAIHYPNLDWVGRCLGAFGTFATAASWYYNWPALMEYVRDYHADVRNQRNWGAADILSSQLQSMLQGLPGLSTWIVIALDPTVPIFSLNGPLGWYDGY
ncbi:MAG: thrombospondin type 3 repeat-containing protein [Verrucomicrobiia bacterium]